MLGKGWDGVGNSAAKVDCLKGVVVIHVIIECTVEDCCHRDEFGTLGEEGVWVSIR